MAKDDFHVAIVGGGLCGLALAIALTKRSVSYTIYEARSSFTEIGAGINLGPNTIQAFDAIDPAVSKRIFELATRNPPGKEDVWMNVRFGAATEKFHEGYLLAEIMAPPTGNMTVSRNELLQMLASNTNLENARFNKKIVDLQQDSNGVTLSFEDGTNDKASVVIGCDGAHSTVRRLVLGLDNPAAPPKYSETGGYRAVFPITKLGELVGKDIARSSTVWCGPGGYVIHYPIDGGKNVNIGVWHWKKGEWTNESWIIPNQKQQMLEEYADWGPSAKKIINAMDDDTAFWATFHHSTKAASHYNGRMCVIGDASHAMTPHQGQGAAQSMEDACVMAEVLQQITTSSPFSLSDQISAAFSGYQSIRKPRFESVLDSSIQRFSVWSHFVREGVTQKDVDDFRNEVKVMFPTIWHPDIPGQRQQAVREMERILQEKK